MKYVCMYVNMYVFMYKNTYLVQVRGAKAR